MPSELNRKEIFVMMVAACIVAGGILVILLGTFGCANVIEESVFGSGTMDHSSYSEHASDRAMTEKAESVAYKMARKWGDNSNQEFTSSFLVSGAGGSYRDQYVVKASGAGYKHTYQATKITGDFFGSGESTITVNTGTESLDSLVLMDGNATFQGRVINGQTGKPVNEAELEAVDKFVIRSYLNITEKPETPEDWLGFCAGLDDDTPNGLLIVPAGYHVEGGRIQKNSTN